MESPGSDRIVFHPDIGGLGEVTEDHRGVGVVDLPDRQFAAIVHIAPGESFADAMADQQAGTLYIVGQGVHRGQQVIPRHGDAFIGEPGAVMNGAVRLELKESGPGGRPVFELPDEIQLSRVIYNGEHESAPFGSDPAAAASAGCNPKSITGYPEQFFFSFRGDASIGTRVADRDDVFGSSKNWFLDYKAREVVVSDALFAHADRPLELGVAKFAFGYDPAEFADSNPADDIFGRPHPESPLDIAPYFGGVDIYSPDHPYADKPRDVIIQNLVIEHYANPAQTGAIGYFRPGLDWLIENNEVRWNNGAGVKFRGDHAIVRDNFIHHNGQLGISAGDGNRVEYKSIGNLEEAGFYGGYAGAGATVQNNEVAYNRLPEIGFNRDWGAGGMNIQQTFDVRIIDNFVHDNDGRGIWLDFDYPGATIEGNLVERNALDGIFIEITSGPTLVADNIVRGNAIEETTWAAQIQVFASFLTEIRDNQIEVSDKNPRGLVLLDNGKRDVEKTPIHAEGNIVVDNDVVIRGGHNNESKMGWSGGQFTRPVDDGDKPQTELYSDRKNLFLRNGYVFTSPEGKIAAVGSSDYGYWRWGEDPSGEQPWPPYLTFAEWQGRGQDLPFLGWGGDRLGSGGIDLLVDRYGDNVLEGLAGRDAIYGEDGDDTLVGGAGADHLVGGEGFDTADYYDSPAPVTLLLSATDAYGIGGIPGTLDVAYAAVRPTDTSSELNHAKGDHLREIEKVAGSNVRTGAPFDDLVFGFDGGTAADLWGGNDIFDNRHEATGRDRVTGGDGNDKIWTGAGNDELYGEAGDDLLFGEDGDDILNGGPGADGLSGGPGFDVADYYDSKAPVRLLLSPTDQYGVGGVAGTANRPAGVSGGDAEGDTLTGIERVAGSNVRTGAPFDDLVFGFDGGTAADLWGGNDIFDNRHEATGRDRVTGGDGNDKIWTGAGNDELYGEAGDDALVGEAGADRHDGGAGRDWLNYTGSPVGVRVVLSQTDQYNVGSRLGPDGGRGSVAPGGKGGHAEGDTYTSMENVVGSNLDDFIYGYDNQEQARVPGESFVRGTTAELKRGNDWFDNNHLLDRVDQVRGDEGDDHIWTGAGNDILNGGPENDDLWGEAGRDIFVFEHDFDLDTVHDFNSGQDRIWIVGFTRDEATIRRSGADTVVQLVSDEPAKTYETITLKGFQAPVNFLDQVVFSDYGPTAPLT